MVAADIDDGSEAHVIPGTKCLSSAIGSSVTTMMGSAVMAAMEHSDQGWNKVGVFDVSAGEVFDIVLQQLKHLGLMAVCEPIVRHVVV